MAELNVSKKSVKEVLDTDMEYVIPDYQRPYRWDEEKCATLWEDVVSFFRENKSNKEEYYLGTLVLCEGEEAGEKEIIDGQQRITSFVLMLRAFYKKLEGMDRSPHVDGLKRQIEPCIWKMDAMSREVEWQIDDASGKSVAKNDMRIVSKIITDNDKEKLRLIIENGEKGTGESNYQENYQYFYDRCSKHAEENPMEWKELCLFILTRCILFPIECKDLNTALTIFYTLNDRGMPLSDTDIFKAQIYKKQESEAAKQIFVEKWKKLEEETKDLGVEMDSIFRYYSHFIRGRDGNTKKEIALRAFYKEENYKKLDELELISNLQDLIAFWKEILYPSPEKRIETQGRKYVHCLCKYPNEYWRYAVSVFFLVHKESKGSDEFKQKFTNYLQKVVAFFYMKFIMNPGVNYIRDDVYRACKNLCENQEEDLFIIKGYSVDDIRKQMHHRIPYKAERGLLLLKAYLHDEQSEIISDNFEVEHILPKKGSAAYYNWSEEDANKYIDDIGNKIVMEKKLNIQAGNNYFSHKREKYSASKIAEVKELGLVERNDWTKEDVQQRKDAVIEEVLKFFEGSGVIAS